MSEPNMSTESDWYCTKARVAHFVGREDSVAEVSDYVMDSAWKWVNGELEKEEIRVTEADVIIGLKADHNIEMAHVWAACDLMTVTISGNQHHGRILPDGVPASQSFAQGDVSMTYHEAKPTEHYDELTTPNFYMRAQRAVQAFLNKLTDEFTRKKKSLIARKNTLQSEEQSDFANRLYSRYRGFS